MSLSFYCRKKVKEGTVLYSTEKKAFLLRGESPLFRKKFNDCFEYAQAMASSLEGIKLG
jgi:hypothetical protein